MGISIITNDEIFNFVSKKGCSCSCKKGQIINMDTEKQSYIYAVIGGFMFVKQSAFNGKELIIKPGNFFLLDISDYEYINYQYYALAKTDCQLVKLRKGVFTNALDKNTNLKANWLTYVYNQVNKKNLIIRYFTLFGKKGALYSTLIRLVNMYSRQVDMGYKILIKLSHKELSQICGTTREFISRSINQLKKENVISYDKAGQYIIVKNIAFLRKFIHCEHCPLHFCELT